MSSIRIEGPQSQTSSGTTYRERHPQRFKSNFVQRDLVQENNQVTTNQYHRINNQVITNQYHRMFGDKTVGTKLRCHN